MTGTISYMVKANPSNVAFTRLVMQTKHSVFVYYDKRQNMWHSSHLIGDKISYMPQT